MTNRPLCYFLCALLALFLTIPAHADVVGLWRFDQEADPQPDSSAFNNHANVFDATWVNDPDRGGVMNFDGQGNNNPVEWLEVEDSDSLSIEETGLTIAAWANFTQFDAWNSIVAKSGESSQNKPSPYDVYTVNNDIATLNFHIGEGNGPIQNHQSEEPFDFDVWTHLAVTLDEEGEGVFYLDGEVNGEFFADREATPLIDEDQNLFIGSRLDGTTNMHGRLDDVAIFNEALTQEQVRTIMSGDFSGFGVGDGGATGDFDGDGDFDADDIDALSAIVKAGTNEAAFDLNADGKVDDADRQEWVTNIKKTWIGDANFDLEFNSSDFVQVFQRGQYEDNVALNSGWADGDWNGDMEFDTSDFVLAFQAGGYEMGPLPMAAVAATVPEPSGLLLLLVGLLTFGIRRNRR